MPRPRLRDDAEILSAVGRIVRTRGLRWTLADVAGEAGLAAPTLVQRFGSKHGLLVAFAAAAAGGVVPAMRAAAAGASGAERPAAALLALAGDGVTPDAIAHQIALLHADLTEPELLTITRRLFTAMAAELERLVEEAMAAGALRPGDAAAVARELHTAWNGTLVTWAVHREGSLAAWAGRDLRAVLARHAR